MLGFIWFCVCVFGFCKHLGAYERQNRSAGIYHLDEKNGGWFVGICMIWIIIWLAPYGLFVTSGMPDGGAYPY